MFQHTKFLIHLEGSEAPSGLAFVNNNQKQNNNKKKKNLGIEWEYADNVGDHSIEWQCNLCKTCKLGGAPCITEHFLGGSKRGEGRTCIHASHMDM